MGRSVQVDATIHSYAEGCVQRRVIAEVGALVGRCAPGKDLVLQALPVPSRDGGVPLAVTASGSASKKTGKGSKPGSTLAGSLQLDEELVLEYACLLERLLPGGLDVVGFYLLCPAAAFAAAAAPLTALAAHAGRELSGRLSSLLLLHIDSVSGELSLRDGGPGAGTAALRPCELKLAKLLDQMVLLQSRYEVSMQLPVTSGRQELAAAFQAAADGAAAGAQGALGLVDGRLATEGWQLADVPAAADDGSAASTGPIAVELLLQPSSSLAMCTAGGGKAGSGLLRGRAEGGAVGQVSIQGCLDCRACLHRREAAAAAVEAVRLDVRRSLQARMDALLDAAEQQQEAAAAEAEEQQGRPHGGAAAAPLPPPPAHPLFAAAGDSSAPLLVSLPRRAFVAAAAAGGLPYCDYLFEGESTQAVLGRLQLLLPMPGLATAAVECLEQAVGRQAPSLSPSAALPLRAGSGSRGVGALPCSALVVGAGAVAVLALAVGYFSLGGQ
ncbi:hypothetical protein D9Q98_003825 [Chlorella vulgaris]|uniref:Uncharacterized protein n=1 Tax=Chlorella vulgaris TaxID=3077 RepID=A0A9D4YXT5_CHLVU|nr:hypothetical protein D9Q98_003825 [Chlorella vulgaris]